jgi:acetylornithine deacetylase
LSLQHLDVDADAVAAHVDRLADGSFAFLERLVAAESTVGREHDAQEIVESELARIGLGVRRLAIRSDVPDDPDAGIPQAAYEGRYNVLGSSGAPEPAVLLNGHVDVVPAEEPALWTSPPFEPRRADGWLYGRGAGDMKGGFAMATLALEALAAAAGALPDVAFLSVIEEECTGNGTLSASLDGVLGDVVVLPEPTDLDLLVAGVGIVWLDVAIHGAAGHAESADRSANPLDAAAAVVEELRFLEREMNASIEPAMDGVAHPYNVNLGVLAAGDWPSSVPAVARMRVRIGHPTAWTTADVERRAREAVDRATARLELEPGAVSTSLSGFRARGYALPRHHRLAGELSDAHATAHGSVPAVVAMGSTTDARIYLNRFERPAICYGPRTRNIHGVDEAVELASIVKGAKTLALFIAAATARDDGR